MRSIEAGNPELSERGGADRQRWVALGVTPLH